MDIVNRLKEYMAHVGLPSTQFADYANIPRPTISQILNGRNRKISNELITKLHVAFPNLNVLWLMFGDGEMEVVPSTIANASPSGQTSVQQPDLFSSSNTPSVAAIAGQLHNADSHIPLRPGNIEEFVDTNRKSHTLPEDSDRNPNSIQLPVSNSKEAPKKIQTIMVFYNDNSYEIFSPSK